MSESDWESIAKERLDAIVQFKTRAEAAEARVDKLEKVLKEIYLHSSDGNAQLLAASWIAGKDEM